MGWVKLDDQFADHPKVMAAGPLAAWLYVCGLTYCARYLTDGAIPASQVRKLADVDNASVLAETLVRVGLWDRTATGYAVHDYLDYQPTAEQVKSEREAAKQRMARLRSPEVRPNNQRTSPPVQAPRTHSHTRTHIDSHRERENAREAISDSSSMNGHEPTHNEPLSLSLVASPAPEQTEPEAESASPASPVTDVTDVTDPVAARDDGRELFYAWRDAVGRAPKTSAERRTWIRALSEMARDVGLSPPDCKPLVAQYRAKLGPDKSPTPGQVAAMYSQLAVRSELNGAYGPHSAAHSAATSPQPIDPDEFARRKRALLAAGGLKLPRAPHLDSLGG